MATDNNDTIFTVSQPSGYDNGNRGGDNNENKSKDNKNNESNSENKNNDNNSNSNNNNSGNDNGTGNDNGNDKSNTNGDNKDKNNNSMKNNSNVKNNIFNGKNKTKRKKLKFDTVDVDKLEYAVIDDKWKEKILARNDWHLRGVARAPAPRFKAVTIKK